MKLFLKLFKRIYRILRYRHRVYSIKVGKKNKFNNEIYIYETNKSIGNYNYFSPNIIMHTATIGNYCSFAPGVKIGLAEHGIENLATSTVVCDIEMYKKETIIGNDVWIGAGAIIRQGVTIGDGAIIGANSFVNKDVPPFAVVVGTPAKILKFRFPEDLQEEISNSRWWEYEPKKAREILKRIKEKQNEYKKNC